MGSRKFRDAYEFEPETYESKGAGLLDRLEAMMPRGQIQPNVASGSPPNGEPEYDPGYYGNQQGGSLGRLLALQAEQSRYQPIPEPKRLLADHLQTFWDRPHPHGLVGLLKAGSDGVVQAVQSSIDATGTPLTEEEAFRQNQGRDFGPAGAFRAASSWGSLTPAGTSGYGFLGDLLLSRAGSSIVSGTNPLNPKPAVPQKGPSEGLSGIVSGKPMPPWPFPPPIFGPRR
ncbi:MAG: hypothetical protein V4517_00740 [Pseudomonadota bacterium]